MKKTIASVIFYTFVALGIGALAAAFIGTLLVVVGDVQSLLLVLAIIVGVLCFGGLFVWADSNRR